jgi:hypothetical protein
MTSSKHRLRFLGAFCLALLTALAPSLSWAIVDTNPNDSGPGSLRQAILAARSDLAADVITFASAILPATIKLSTLLPALNTPGDTIDGAGQVTLDGAKISVDGNGAPCDNQCHGIEFWPATRPSSG